MKAQIDSALSDLKAAPPEALMLADRPLREWRWCNHLRFALELLDLVLTRTSRWNVVVRWVLGSLIDGLKARLEEECADGHP